jgi:lipid A oxidase
LNGFPGGDMAPNAGKMASMISASGSRRPPARLAAIGIAGALFAAAASETRLRLPFDLFPGAVYLALLSVPMLSRREGSPDGAPDVQLGAYLGPAYTPPSDVRLTQPGGTDALFHDIPWEGKPFRPPPYYGYRAILWPRSGKLGLMGDFTHIKAISIKDAKVRQTGMRDGAAMPPEEPVSTTFKRLEFTHGYNLITANLLRRGEPKGPWLVPYGGVGLGIAYPHVEMQRAHLPVETRTYEYQVAGPAFQVLGGVEWRFRPRFSLFVEYKLSCAAIRGDLVGGGTVAADLCTHQLPVGIAVHLRARSVASTP